MGENALCPHPPPQQGQRRLSVPTSAWIMTRGGPSPAFSMWRRPGPMRLCLDPNPAVEFALFLRARCGLILAGPQGR
jgi:hypothetical protein